ncbi:MAG: lipocalin-like domain-containing protein, partial [Gammaproteobacteria bacterium]
MSRLVSLSIALLMISGCSSDTVEVVENGQNAATRFLTGVADSGYARVTGSRPFDFPRDHASHPEYRSEWWYFTGNLTSEDGHRYGFELTFFRFALAPTSVERRSEWGTNQAWMAHLSLTDEDQNRFVTAERFSREALGLAGSSLGPFALRIEDWSAESGGSELFPLRLRATDEAGEIDLTLVPLKGPVAQGEDGFDRKGAEEGNASYYYSFTRLRTEGRIR